MRQLISFKKGDKVSILSESGELEVIRVKSEYLVEVEDEFGFTRSVNPKELSLIHSKDYGVIPAVSKDEELLMMQVVESKPVKKKIKSSNWNGFPYIDLHIEELREDHLTLPVQDIVQIQLSHFRAFIRKCQNKNEKKCYVIHGVGEGVLRSEVHLYLHRMDGVHYEDAHSQEFGELGATEVQFFL